MSESRLCGLERTGALVMLAQSIYYGHLTTEGLDGPHWDALPMGTRHQFVEFARCTLAQIAPAAVSRPTPGTQTPQSEEGDGGARPGLFDRIADVARAEARKVLAFREGK